VINIYFTGQDIGLYAVIREHLLNAEKRIWIEMYDLSSDEIIDLLKRIGEKANIDIRILLDLNDNNIDKWTKHGKTKQLKWGEIRFGNPNIFWAYHLKLAIIDDTIIFGSANWSYSGLIKNREAILVIQDKNILNKCTEIFLQDWQNAVTETTKKKRSILHILMKKFIRG
jgi:phosphatidylserine/phosphatidylglycerophosphate/cardiolipin synthase-like enzyme